MVQGCTVSSDAPSPQSIPSRPLEAAPIAYFFFMSASYAEERSFSGGALSSRFPSDVLVRGEAER
jgi:hypothetical protein